MEPRFLGERFWTWTTPWWFWTNPFGKYPIRQLWKIFPRDSRGWNSKKKTVWVAKNHLDQKLDGILGINDIATILLRTTWPLKLLHPTKLMHRVVAFFLNRHCAQHWRSRTHGFGRLLSSYLPPIFDDANWCLMSLSNVRRSWVFIEKSLVKSWLFLFLDFCSPHGAAKLWSVFSLSSKMAHRKKNGDDHRRFAGLPEKNMAVFVA